MTTVVLTPNGTVGNTGTLTGGATAHAVLADSDIGTYITCDPGEGATVNLTSTTLSAGQIVSGIQLLLEAGGVGGNIAAAIAYVGTSSGDIYAGAQYDFTADDSTGAFVGPFLARAFTQAELDALTITVALSSPKFGAGTALEWATAWLGVIVAEVPTVTVTAPTGTVGTATPTVAWTYTPGSDGGPQSKYRVKVFTAAQYGAGGFDPETSTSVYDSGTLTGAAASHLVASPLVTGTTYRAYVKVTHTINAQDASSAWAFSGFTTSFATSDISTVTTSANNSTGAITVTINRNTGSQAWDSIDLERSEDGGTTWLPVRGATRQGATNTWLTSFAANSAVVVDYEAPNGTSVTYRARATNDNAGSDVTGAWVSSSSTSWTSTSTFIKDPLVPTRNSTFRLAIMPTQGSRRPQGVNDVIGRADPIVIVDTRRTPEGQLTIHTSNQATATALDALADSTIWLLHGPSAHRLPAYIAPDTINEVRAVRTATDQHRYWEVGYRVVAAPADET